MLPKPIIRGLTLACFFQHRWNVYHARVAAESEEPGEFEIFEHGRAPLRRQVEHLLQAVGGGGLSIWQNDVASSV